MELLYLKNAKKKKRRRRLKPSALIGLVVLLAVAVIALVLLIFLGGAEGRVSNGRLELQRSFDAVVIRNERIFSTEEFELADYYLDEGSEVRAGDHVMDVYKMGYNQEITLSLRRTLDEVYRAQLEVIGEARDIELRGYDNSVAQAKESISEAVLSGETGEVARLQRELAELLEERSEYLRSSIHETETLRSLYRREAEAQRTVTDLRLSLYAETDGRLSYYLDDFSAALNADKLSSVTSDLVSSIIKRSKPAKWTGSSKTGAFRVVNTGEWYCAFLTDASEPLRLAAGESYPIEVAGYGAFTGTAVSSTVSGKKVVNILRVDSEMGALIDARTIGIKVRFDASGLMIERRAVQYENGEPYVEVIRDGERVGVYINVHSSSDGAVIISPKDTQNAPLSEGVKYWIPKRQGNGSK